MVTNPRIVCGDSRKFLAVTDAMLDNVASKNVLEKDNLAPAAKREFVVWRDGCNEVGGTNLTSLRCGTTRDQWVGLQVVP